MRRLLPLLFLSAPLLAADPPKEKGTGFAFLVAAEGYDVNELRPLKFVAKETEEFRQVLLKTGFDERNVKFLHDKADRRYQPERKKIAAEFELLLGRVGADDTVVVLLNGHGVHFTGDATGYFCPVDAKLTDKATLVPMDGKGGVFEQLKACKARRKVLLVNACRNDPRSDRSLAGNKITLDDEDKDEVPEGIAALYSCRPGEMSYQYDPANPKSKDRERSLYMHHLIAAWGKGGTTTIEDVFKQVRDNTAADADDLFGRKQNPVIRREYRGEGEWLVASVAASTAKEPKPTGPPDLKATGPTDTKPGGKGKWPGHEDYQKAFRMHYGVGVKVDHKKAAELFQKAAEAGHPLAKVELADLMYYGSHGVTKDTKKPYQLVKDALPEVQKGVADEDPDALFTLGFMYLRQWEYSKDGRAGEKCLLKAAELGHAESLHRVQQLYRNGNWVKEDKEKAEQLCRRAAAQNHVGAMRDMGDYFNGDDAEKKDGKPSNRLTWYLKAAELDDGETQRQLGFMYKIGDGVEKDLTAAKMWYQKAADLGNSRAKDDLKELEEKK